MDFCTYFAPSIKNNLICLMYYQVGILVISILLLEKFGG